MATEILIWSLWFVVCVGVGYYGHNVIDWVISLIRGWWGR